MMTRMSPKAQDIAFGARGYTMTPTASGPTIRSKKVDGGYLVNGRGHWGTGVMHADWMLTTGILDDDVTRIQLLIPINDIEIMDVWNMSGMAATGSNDFVMKDVFVPDYMTEDTDKFFDGHTEGSALHPNPMYQLPLMQIIYAEMVGMFVGSLQGMNAGYQAIVKKHVATLTGEVVSEKTTTHTKLGEGHAKELAALDLMHSLIASITAHQGQEWDMETRVSNKVRASYLVRFCVNAINELALKCGASGFHVDSPTQRIFRDMNTIGTHGFLDWDVSKEQWGRDFLGLNTNHALV